MRLFCKHKKKHENDEYKVANKLEKIMKSASEVSHSLSELHENLKKYVTNKKSIDGYQCKRNVTLNKIESLFYQAEKFKAVCKTTLEELNNLEEIDIINYAFAEFCKSYYWLCPFKKEASIIFGKDTWDPKKVVDKEVLIGYCIQKLESFQVVIETDYKTRMGILKRN